MSFSKDVKKEILDNKFASKETTLAFLCGLMMASAEFEVSKNKIESLHLVTDVPFLYDYLKEMCENTFSSSDIEVSNAYKISSTQYYKISFNQKLKEDILLETNILENKNNKLVKQEDVSVKILKDMDCIKAFVSGAYMGCGTSSIKLDENSRTTTGYHIEFSSDNYNLLSEVANCFAQFDILAKLTKRKNLYVLYIKDAEEVSNVLALMGASNAVLLLQNEIVIRQVRNKVNRQNNCFISNFNKTLDASYKQLEAIKVLEENYGLNNLPEELQQVALLRLANPEESLDHLLKLTKLPMTKSALNYKFTKLIKLAKKIKG